MNSTIQEITTLVRHMFVAKYFNVASAVILVFDTLENFSDEVELIWNQRWSVGKALYIASRYLVFVDVSLMLIYLFDSRLETKACHRVYITTTYFSFIGACIAELVLLIRVYAIWKQSAIVLAILCFMSLVFVITSILNLNIHDDFRTLKFFDSPVPSIIPCFRPRIEIRAFIDFGCLVLLDLTIVIFTAWGAVTYWKENASSPLMSTFYRDGVLYFICLFALSLANVVDFIVGDTPQQGTLLELQRVIHSVISARIILNLRKVFVASDDETKDFTTVVFGELISDPYSQSGYTSTTHEEEGIELHDLRSATRRIALESIDVGGEDFRIP
ncbi:hypothetical protein SCHPADRAFT_195431 [Schizopora paradoxa]|uniref:DUF6533 domain-containing protein n=1 Tax=Schizopora paradoxa TaxID=27342 RepID=A0A0H2S595_9AGAM|nr:hypothetical protein SCHPADRAFT_195431 [Schizopora paradoxa]